MYHALGKHVENTNPTGWSMVSFIDGKTEAQIGHSVSPLGLQAGDSSGVWFFDLLSFLFLSLQGVSGA